VAILALMAISLMWIPVGLLNLGKGEAKGTGVVTLMVGTVTIICAIIEATIFNDPWVGALLFTYGLFYNTVGYALASGAKDLKFVGNASICVGLISIGYIILCLAGPAALRSNFLAMACAGYLVLYIMVVGNAYGWLSGKVTGVSLIVWTFVGLYLPAFWLVATGKLPF